MGWVYPEFQQLEAASVDLKAARTAFYCRVYPQLLRATAQFRDSEDHSSLIAIAHMAYGWMPTALRGVEPHGFHGLGPEPLLQIRKDGSALDIIESFPSRSPINGSWVGLSKLLHFVNPSRFPIWDNRVAANFGLNYATAVNSQSVYIRYSAWVEAHKAEPVVTEMQAYHSAEFGYEITDVRALELLLFARAKGRS